MNLKKPALILTAIVCCGALLAACSSDDSTSEGVTVSDAWTRITAPTATMGAVYMDLESADGDRLISASVPTGIAGKAEIHETVTGGADTGSTMEGDSMGGDTMEGDSMGAGQGGDAMMGMREMKDGLELPAGEDVSLEPGGYHIMLLELQAPIVEGDTIPVTLMFENAGEVQIDAQARSDES
jgi:copper(I)-binding protein